MKLLKTAITAALFGLVFTSANAQQPPRPNTFLLESFQAGSTTLIGALRVIDLSSGTVVYTNGFSQASAGTNGLNLFYYPLGFDDNFATSITNSPSKTFVANGNLRLETYGYLQNGGGAYGVPGYNSLTSAEYANALPSNFLVDFNAVRLQWAGHFHFFVFYRQPSDALNSRNPNGGVFSTNRSLALRADDLQLSSSGSSFNPYGLETNAVIHPAFAMQFAAPAGDPTSTHRYGIALSNNIASYYLDGILQSSGDISQWVSDNVCTPHKATATAQLVNGNVTGAVLADYGCGYTNVPLVLVQGGGGSDATATATINGGMVTSINITSTGCCYTNTPKIVIASPPFVPSVNIRFSRVQVTQHVTLGRNYVLESSTDLENWVASGSQFNAQSEDIVNEFIISQTGQYFRLRQMP